MLLFNKKTFLIWPNENMRDAAGQVKIFSPSGLTGRFGFRGGVAAGSTERGFHVRAAGVPCEYAWINQSN